MPAFEDIRCLDAPLVDKLAVYEDHLADAAPEIARVYSALVERLLAADAGSQAPEIGGKLPAFLLPDNDGSLTGSADFLRGGPLVVSFNRGHWCKFCQLELLALTEIHPQVEQLGGRIVSIMPDCAAPVGRLRQTLNIQFPVLTDIDNGYALSCGLMVSLGDAIRKVYLKSGRELAEFQGNDAWFVPIPATFVVGTDGRIIGRLVDADFRHRMAPGDILKCLEQIS